jgi:3-oxoacyl-[acyl-carrier-protein] synthase III
MFEADLETIHHRLRHSSNRPDRQQLIQSRWLDLSPESGSISMLFGDGAAALIVSNKEQGPCLRIIDVNPATAGSFVDDLGVRCPGSEFCCCRPSERGLPGEPVFAARNPKL